MKNIFKSIATLALSFCCLAVAAQDKPVKSKDRTSTQVLSPERLNQLGDGYIMYEGKVMQVKNGKAVAVEKDMVLTDGTKIMRDGSISYKDGRKARLNDGDFVSMEGRVMAGGLSAESMAKMEDGIYKEDAKIMIVKDGQAREMKTSKDLPAGMQIAKDGTVTLPNGKKTMLNEGDYLLITGEKRTVADMRGTSRVGGMDYESMNRENMMRTEKMENHMNMMERRMQMMNRKMELMNEKMNMMNNALKTNKRTSSSMPNTDRIDQELKSIDEQLNNMKMDNNMGR
ncbi:MAG: hypothetical protein LPJ89_11645 [Hymenobacteraceae bacterium]|nr:hypothetical protein [Hymenobacteraceae bacterium]MDX5395561.1 hypothetical protein [Hymenobacteraceae bacterium]MDX5444420.1 hypothetical protein [Hymenobacteraceae bacterium]MDX5511615.1 hypothetical protein [Hymenobacteraceae bacterium]